MEVEEASAMTAWAGSHGTTGAQTQVEVALAVGVLPAAMVTFFVCAEILSDPGGWQGLGIVVVWVLPMLALAALALRRPDWAASVMTTLVGGWVAVSLLTLVFATAWAQYEDTHGPIGLIVMLALCVPLVLLGRARALRAGILLLIAVITPILCGIAAMLVTSTVGGGIVLVMIGGPFLVSGVLLVLAGRSERTPSRGLGS
jgi:hypothetical protein